MSNRQPIHPLQPPRASPGRCSPALPWRPWPRLYFSGEHFIGVPILGGLPLIAARPQHAGGAAGRRRLAALGVADADLHDDLHERRTPHRRCGGVVF